jgi:hypothetical protein
MMYSGSLRYGSCHPPPLTQVMDHFKFLKCSISMHALRPYPVFGTAISRTDGVADIPVQNGPNGAGSAEIDRIESM